MADTALFYYNRYTRQVEEEIIYGGGWLRWLYATYTGRAVLHTVVKRAFFSRWYGWRMDRPASRDKVLPFVVKYGIDADEFARSVWSYGSFNEFFYRRLKREARPLAAGEEVLVFPADGRHLCFPAVEEATGFLIKGQTFTLGQLFADEELAHRFKDGTLVISRLCPVDYHRFHFPCDGRAGEPRLINGSLYSVNTLALKRNIRYLVENKRYVTLMETPRFGTVAYVEVGATCVGSVCQSYEPGRPVRKGEEKGYFKFGGSCVMLVFERGRIEIDRDVVEQSLAGVETYARMGDRLGVAAAY